jgi:endogenous inhibitor of DNA gyrase (YacG/DUF329 family)
MMSEIKCPQCRKPTTWKDNPDRPFCSNRCRLIDLGQWADESYKIKGPSQQELSENNVIPLHDENQ